jgi:hypothetical protein
VLVDVVLPTGAMGNYWWYMAKMGIRLENGMRVNENDITFSRRAAHPDERPRHAINIQIPTTRRCST